MKKAKLILTFLFFLYNTQALLIKSHIGMSPSGKALDFDSSMRRFESCHPSHLIINLIDPLAQLAEHLTFNQGVRRSNRRWITNFGEVSKWS